MIPLPDLASVSSTMSECNSELQRCEVMRDVLTRYSPSEDVNADTDADDPFAVSNLLGLSSDDALDKKSAVAAEESLDDQAGAVSPLTPDALLRHLAALGDPDAGRAIADEERDLFEAHRRQRIRYNLSWPRRTTLCLRMMKQM